MTQLDLLVGLPAPAAEDSLQAAIARARECVDGLLRRRVCGRCCGDERLMFVHREPSPWNVEVSDLVLLGAASSRIRLEVAACDVVCRRCWLGRWRPQMLRAEKTSSVVMVAKARSTSGGSENAIVRAPAKVRRSSKVSDRAA